MGAGPVETRTLALDAQGLARLKQEARQDPQQAAGAAARQFEALLVNMMLKSMRQASMQDGPFDNDQSRLYTSLLDQQLSQHLAARGMGLGAVLTRQLSANGAASAQPASGAASTEAAPGTEMSRPGAVETSLKRVGTGAAAPRTDTLGGPRPKAPAANGTAPGASGTAPAATPVPVSKTREFVDRVWSHAVDAARATGIQPRFMVGQAALESGWGRNEIRGADGSPTHNLFGVKAGRNWNGPVVEKTTTEYVNGVAQKVTAKFRVYSSYAESFRDYANLMLGNRRYAGVIEQGQDAAGFARGLQQAGYATDPQYADKLQRIINGPTLRNSLLG